MIHGIYTFLKKFGNWIKPLFGKVIYVGEYVTDRNFGDALNFVLLSEITGRRIIPKRYCFSSQYAKHDNLQFIGSTIQKSDTSSIVWGAGAMRYDDTILAVKKILSVRGPLTRDLLICQGFECPEIYGDPALLLPKYYQPTSCTIKGRIGFIPHWVDKPSISKEGIWSETKVIDIQMPISIFKPSIYSHYREFIDVINSCEVIIATCLHGLIIADAYHKPTLWVKLGSNIGGDDIKFYDYYASMGIYKDSIHPIELTKKKYSLEELVSMASIKPIDKIDIDKVLSLNPFK